MPPSSLIVPGQMPYAFAGHEKQKLYYNTHTGAYLLLHPFRA
jgi:hypothetical protein